MKILFYQMKMLEAIYIIMENDVAKMQVDFVHYTYYFTIFYISLTKWT